MVWGCVRFSGVSMSTLSPGKGLSRVSEHPSQASPGLLPGVVAAASKSRLAPKISRGSFHDLVKNLWRFGGWSFPRSSPRSSRLRPDFVDCCRKFRAGSRAIFHELGKNVRDFAGRSIPVFSRSQQQPCNVIGSNWQKSFLLRTFSGLSL